MYIEIVENDCIYVCMYGIVVCCIGMYVYVFCTEWVAGCISSVYCYVLVSVFG